MKQNQRNLYRAKIKVDNFKEMGLYSGMRSKTRQLSSRPLSARERFESNNQKRNEEAWKREGIVNSAIEMKKKEWAAKVYTSLAVNNRDISSLEWREREEMNKKLEKRRDKLKKLFAGEDIKFKKEREEKMMSKSRITKNPFHPEIELLRTRLDDLKRENEEERKKLSEKLSYESWRKNNPELRQMESERLNKFIMDAWVDQKQWKEDQRRILEEERRKAELESAEQWKMEEEEEKIREERCKAERLKWTNLLEEQIQELRKREKDEELIQEKEIALEKESNRLQDLVKKRDRMKEDRKRKNLELFWARQYQLKLKKKTTDIQTELMDDSVLLEDILRGIHADSSLEAKDEFVRESEWMKKVLEEQKRLEKLREREYELLFSEEAEKMWRKREAEWEKEQRARDKLMEDVMRELKTQVADKISSLRHEKETRKKGKEDLILFIEDTQIKLEDKGDEKWERGLNKGNIEPIPSDRNIRRQELLMDMQIEDRQKEISRLEEEMRKLWQGSYAPPKYGRKRAIW